jgi:hypothetical protein
LIYIKSLFSSSLQRLALLFALVDFEEAGDNGTEKNVENVGVAFPFRAS